MTAVAHRSNNDFQFQRVLEFTEGSGESFVAATARLRERGTGRSVTT